MLNTLTPGPVGCPIILCGLWRANVYSSKHHLTLEAALKLIRSSEVAPVDDSSPIFIGAVTRQALVGRAESKDYNLAIVNFAPGARNKFHRHTHEQVLFVTYGAGYVATEAEKLEVHQGEIILVPATEKHWHGATEHSAFSHISLTASNSTTEILE